MEDELDQAGWLRTGVASAMVKALDRGADAMLREVNELFLRMFPTRVQSRFSGLFPRKLVGTTLDLGDERFLLDLLRNGSIEGTVIRVSRGIVLGREVIALDDWVEAVTVALETLVERDAQARIALEKWLGKTGQMVD